MKNQFVANKTKDEFGIYLQQEGETEWVYSPAPEGHPMDDPVGCIPEVLTPLLTPLLTHMHMANVRCHPRHYMSYMT